MNSIYEHQEIDILAREPEGRTFAAAIVLILGFALAGIGVAHYQGSFHLPEEFSFIPLSAICGLLAVGLIVMAVRYLINRKGFQINRGKSSIQRIDTGIFGTRYFGTYSINQVTHIRIYKITEKTSGNRPSRRTYYHLYLHYRNEASEQIFRSDNYKTCRCLCEGVAKAMNIEMHDETELGKIQIRSADELNKTVGEKLRKKIGRHHSVEIPTKMHAKIGNGTNKLVIDIPPFDLSSLGPAQKVVWIIFITFGITAAITFYLDAYFFSLVTGAIFATGFYLIFRSETVILTGNRLSVRSGIFFFKKTANIPLSELEELFLDSSINSQDDETINLIKQEDANYQTHSSLESAQTLRSYIVARSDRHTVRFGRILSQTELKYILYQMENWIRNNTETLYRSKPSHQRWT